MNPQECRELPVISQGHFDNLVIDRDDWRVWVSRLTVADGAREDMCVMNERKDEQGRWYLYTVSQGDEWVFAGDES